MLFLWENDCNVYGKYLLSRNNIKIYWIVENDKKHELGLQNNGDEEKSCELMRDPHNASLFQYVVTIAIISFWTISIMTYYARN